MVILGMVIFAICILLVCASYPLSVYVANMEMDGDCEGCTKKEACFAQRRIWKDSTWIDEFMLLSFLFITPYCEKIKHSKRRIYFVILLITTILVGILFWSKGVSLGSIVFGVSAMMLFALSIVDWNTEYIPVEYTLVILMCGLIHLFADFSNWYEYVIGLIAVSGFLLLVDKIGTPILAKRYGGTEEITKVIGDGDIKLMAATGLLLGWKLNFLALGIGCISGSVIHLVRMKIKESGGQLALGPYLSLGVYITMICGEQLISWYLNMLGL